MDAVGLNNDGSVVKRVKEQFKAMTGVSHHWREVAAWKINILQFLPLENRD